MRLLSVNHNDFYSWKGHAMEGEFHCWLFHSLYDHHHLEWDEILSITDISVDINFKQSFEEKIDFKKQSKPQIINLL